jgi:hypothetical protein
MLSVLRFFLGGGAVTQNTDASVEEILPPAPEFISEEGLASPHELTSDLEEYQVLQEYSHVAVDTLREGDQIATISNDHHFIAIQRRLPLKNCIEIYQAKDGCSKTFSQIAYITQILCKCKFGFSVPNSLIGFSNTQPGKLVEVSFNDEIIRMLPFRNVQSFDVSQGFNCIAVAYTDNTVMLSAYDTCEVFFTIKSRNRRYSLPTFIGSQLCVCTFDKGQRKWFISVYNMNRSLLINEIPIEDRIDSIQVINDSHIRITNDTGSKIINIFDGDHFNCSLGYDLFCAPPMAYAVVGKELFVYNLKCVLKNPVPSN